MTIPKRTVGAGGSFVLFVLIPVYLALKVMAACKYLQDMKRYEMD